MARDRPTVQFLGAAGTVTGSAHLVRAGGHAILLDCGLFQGNKELRERNWRPFPLDPATLDAVVLSHAHIDHSGRLPLLARQGFRGPIFCSTATRALLDVMLPDSAHLQEEQAERANRRGYTRHKPALPLYTMEDATRALQLVAPQAYGEAVAVAPGMKVRFRTVGHILGAASVDLAIDGRPDVRLVFSGDLGRYDRPILRDPEPVASADVLLCESTYGDVSHPSAHTAVDELARVVRDGARRGGAILVPAFALGRTQELLWLLQELENEKRIPALPVYVDSPMAVEITDLYGEHPQDHDVEMKERMLDESGAWQGKRVRLVRSVAESKTLNERRGPMIIISASGMATGGRILHHLFHRLPDIRTTVLLVGFQADGTRGRALREGARVLRMFGQEVRVRATIERIDALSAHAGRDEILRWLDGFERPPRMTYLVHGEAESASALEAAITARGWQVAIAGDGETRSLAEARR